MNCTEAAEFLDRIVFEDVPANAGLRQHLDACPACNQVFQDALKAREVIVMVRRLEPVLTDPSGFTEEIMSSIGQAPDKTAPAWLFLQRILAAASVAFFLIFGYEQYNVVKKIVTLETQFSLIKADSVDANPLRQASTFYISQAGVSFSELENLLHRARGTTRMTFSYQKKLLHQRNIK